jgi:hypothetical protein
MECENMSQRLTDEKDGGERKKRKGRVLRSAGGWGRCGSPAKAKKGGGGE